MVKQRRSFGKTKFAESSPGSSRSLSRLLYTVGHLCLRTACTLCLLLSGVFDLQIFLFFRSVLNLFSKLQGVESLVSNPASPHFARVPDKWELVQAPPGTLSRFSPFVSGVGAGVSNSGARTTTFVSRRRPLVPSSQQTNK